MTDCLFVGPSLRPGDLEGRFDGIRLPPARQGDIYRAVRRHQPRAIGLIDGYFHQVPSVTHKEILWAMTRGVHVLGAASMGALRAAELHPFGMIGVGRIFAAYRDAVFRPFADPFEDDDEVAVIHAPPELGFAALSEALVNIRATLAAAVAQGVIDAASGNALLAAAKGTYYPERDYDTLARAAAAQGAAPLAVKRLLDWLPGGRVDQKRSDAAALVEALRQPLPDLRVTFHLAHTTMWDGIMARSEPE